MRGEAEERGMNLILEVKLRGREERRYMTHNINCNDIMLTEFQECRVFVEYLQLNKKVLLYSHIPNETFTKSWNQKRKNKAMGVAAGFPDYCILTRKRAIFVEMKQVKGNKSTPSQDAWIETLNTLGVPAKVCFGAQQAIEFVEENM